MTAPTQLNSAACFNEECQQPAFADGTPPTTQDSWSLTICKTWKPHQNGTHQTQPHRRVSMQLPGGLGDDRQG